MCLPKYTVDFQYNLFFFLHRDEKADGSLIFSTSRCHTLRRKAGRCFATSAIMASTWIMSLEVLIRVLILLEQTKSVISLRMRIISMFWNYAICAKGSPRCPKTGLFFMFSAAKISKRPESKPLKSHRNIYAKHPFKVFRPAN